MFVFYILVGVLLFFILMNLSVVLRAKLKKGRLVPDIGGEIGRAIDKGEKVILYFYSPTCSACKVQTPIIDKLINSGNGKAKIFKIDVSRDVNVALKLGVMGTPSTVVIENGKIKEFFVGVKSENILRRFL
ncbi:Thioredoxin [Candidatus Kryptonium thompsonii]|jgi:thiol-disulfide isomerase/thioredoxin|uniref:thioredoxin family protein n=1 Tax=Candidatus Kryptonium thompsonii TaxID=1633631 RepID=UPI00063EC89D|nr:thioredoxin family protein [Candidatus Kryptonium thompsoni]CUS78721.1 Thioredoxin [Candidatus Kryptonium thompsoni]CUS86404.1 Thioredoxin [Candidatus Kryptonium thompsoni]CUS88156.1 Thioredoxin [Candidatus Kryptonium thompsoni]CUS89537.1 Thioredoxin [Candidatus Kryptonium thompsoni]CUT01663.1 Thioredoxin [Candidatus Kryptonium thompsoni]